MPDNDDNGIILMHQHQRRSNSSARTQGPFDGAHGRLSTDVSTFLQTARRLSVDSWETRTITTSADYATSVFAIDVDGDGDVDVLSAS